ncbi:hypothetical protein T08_14436 [Trichinella sp. T8]|nr:hypothetical protein T08_14436 [Trichinella sp. T8]
MLRHAHKCLRMFMFALHLILVSHRSRESYGRTFVVICRSDSGVLLLRFTVVDRCKNVREKHDLWKRWKRRRLAMTPVLETIQVSTRRMRLSASGLLLGDGSYGVSGEAGRLSILSFLDLSGRPSMHYSLPPSFDVGDVEVDDENICTFDVLGIAARYPELDRFHSVYASSNNDNCPPPPPPSSGRYRPLWESLY